MLLENPVKSSMSEEGKLVSIVIHGEQQGNLKGYQIICYDCQE